MLIVLWSLVFLSVLVSPITSSARTEIKLASNIREAATAESAADGAIHQTMFHLLAAGQQHWAASGYHRITIGAATVQVSIDNLTGRVNPNTATPELMRELIVALGGTWSEATTLGEAIVTWRTPSQQPGTRIADGSGLPFADIDELGALRGMTPGLLQELRPHLTLWWENDPDPAFADPIVMQAMQALGDSRPRSGLVEPSDPGRQYHGPRRQPRRRTLRAPRGRDLERRRSASALAHSRLGSAGRAGLMQPL